MDSGKNKVVKNFMWRLFERIGAQGVTFIVSVILARLLDPAVYGTIALVTVFTTIMQVFVDSGLGNALIQKKSADDLDFSTVFYFNIAVCVILYVLMYMAAPYIAAFYKISELTPLVRVLSITLIISGVKNVQQAYVSKHMLFKKFFFATLGGTIGAAILGIFMAYRGYGVWALVAQNIFNMTLDTIILWITVKWRPKRMFSFERLSILFSFGIKLLISSLIDTIYKDLRALVIGKMYTTEDLAFYNKGQQFPNLIVTNINTSIDSVLLPAMSQEQDNVERVKSMTRRSISISSYIMWPLMIGLAVCAEPLVSLVLTDKWLPCVFFLRIYCITYAFYPIHTANLNAIKAMGRSDLFLILEILKKSIGFVLLLVTMRISVEAMAYSLLVNSFASQIINSWPNRKLLGYSYLEQMKDILPYIFASIMMGAVVWYIPHLLENRIIILAVQVLAGVIVYLLISVLFHLESYEYIIATGKQYLHRKG